MVSAQPSGFLMSVSVENDPMSCVIDFGEISREIFGKTLSIFTEMGLKFSTNSLNYELRLTLMDKNSLIMYIEAYADAKCTKNRLLIEFAASKLQLALNCVCKETYDQNSEEN